MSLESLLRQLVFQLFSLSNQLVHSFNITHNTAQNTHKNELTFCACPSYSLMTNNSFKLMGKWISMLKDFYETERVTVIGFLSFTRAFRFATLRKFIKFPDGIFTLNSLNLDSLLFFHFLFLFCSWTWNDNSDVSPTRDIINSFDLKPCRILWSWNINWHI